jgi:hypothetical protein
MSNHHENKPSTETDRESKVVDALARFARESAAAHDTLARQLEELGRPRSRARAPRAIPPPHVSFTERDEIAARRALGKGKR